MATDQLSQLQAWSSRLGLINGILFTGLGLKSGHYAWHCPTADALAVCIVMLSLGSSNLIDFFAAGRDRIAAMTWCHTLGFAALVALAYKHPETVYIIVAVAWGLLSIMGPIMALRRPDPTGSLPITVANAAAT